VSNCVLGVTGGKSTITGGVLTVNARLNPGASCDSLGASLSSLSKAVITLKLTTTVTTTDPITLETTSTTNTSAVVHVKQPVTASLGGGGVVLSGQAQQSASMNKPFGGETVEVTLPATGDCSAAPLASIPLGGKVAIHP
jgi:hypothetical protein